ncbi:extracellular solute-binding protein family 5 [Natronorubrum tibetense GA33]|uniref:Extracellular solute-binding protein family 5 n=2 Tax=Natronorubrum tibetense TaxID=63128 RepID=L9VXP1_9EURY|nr:extracellular solute-binding protein family 5 [Natronorubrum tibetense GA33]
MLAGCADSTDDPHLDDDEGTIVSAINEPLSADYSWNYYNDVLSVAADDFLYSSAFVYTPNTDELHAEGVADYDIDGNELWLEYRDDWYWHNGDEVTTEDVSIGFDYHFWLQEADGARESGLLEDDGFVVESDKTATMVFRDDIPQSRFWATDSLVREPYAANRTRHADWHDELGSVDATSDEWLELWEEFTNDEDQFYPPVGNGPVEYVEHSDTSLTLERFDDHFAAETLDFTGMRLDYHEDEFLAFIEGQIDYTDVGMPVEPEDEGLMPDDYDYYGQDQLRQAVLKFNNGHDLHGDTRPTWDVNIRKAIEYTFDRDAFTSAMPYGYEPLEFPWDGLPDEIVEGQSDEFLAMLDDVDFETRDHDEDRAKELIDASENYSYDESEEIVVCENGDANSDPGEQATIQILSRQDIRLDIAQICESELSAFGWDVTINAVDSGAESERRRGGEYDFKTDTTGVRTLPSHLNDWVRLEDRQHTPRTFEVPWPPGDADGDSHDWDHRDAYSRFLSTPADASDEDWGEYLIEAAWVWNQTVPSILIASLQDVEALATDRFDVDYDHPSVRLAHQGEWFRLPEEIVWSVE